MSRGSSCLEYFVATQKDVMCNVLAPMLELDTLIALCVASAYIRRTWLASESDWQARLKFSQWFAQRLRWQDFPARTRQNVNVLKCALYRIRTTMTMDKGSWWCMGGCGILFPRGSMYLVHRDICRRPTCIDCLCQKARYNGNKLIIGIDEIIRVHRDCVLLWLQLAYNPRSTHAEYHTSPPLMLYTPANNKQLFKIFEHNEHGSDTVYAIWESDMIRESTRQAQELASGAH